MLLSFFFWEFAAVLPWDLLPCDLFWNMIGGRFSLAQVSDSFFIVWMLLLGTALQCDGQLVLMG